MPRRDFLLAYLLETVFDNLSDEQAGQLIKAIFDYEIRREEPTFDDEMLQFVFDTVIKPKSDENMESYNKRCERQRSNVLKRWGKGKNDTTVYDGKSGMPKIPPYTNDTKHTDIDIDNDNDKSLSISTEAAKIAGDFSQLLGNRKISIKKRLELLRRYREMRETRSKEEVDQELLDYLAQE